MKYTLTIALCHVASCLLAQYKPAPSSSTIEFSVRYLGINTRGTLAGLKGQVSWGTGGSLVDSKFDVSVDANSIQTGIDLRDSHLRGKEFLDAEKYPLIHFVSAEVKVGESKDSFLMRGQLTIRNHTKEISFPFSATPVSNGYIFKGSFTINRQDFEVGNSMVISDKVELMLNVTVVK